MRRNNKIRLRGDHVSSIHIFSFGSTCIFHSLMIRINVSVRKEFALFESINVCSIRLNEERELLTGNLQSIMFILNVRS